MALVNVYSINVDIKRRMTSVVPTFKQGDAATLKFRVYDDGVLLELTNDMYSEITFTLPNGETLLGYPELVNGELVYDFTGLEMVRPGKIITILSIMKNSTMVSIPPFNCFIFDSMRTETLSYIGILQDLIKETQDLGLNFEDITDRLADILDLAEGELDELQDAVQTATSEVVTWRSDEQQRVTREQQRINSESTRASNEQSRVNAESNRVTKENARTSAENARVQAESSRVTAFNNQMQQATSKINEMDILIDNLESFDYSPSVTYDFPNLVTYNGSTYMALKQVRNITPTNDKVNYRLVAQRGVDGTGSVSKVNGVSPDANGNVVIDVGDSEELNIHKNNSSPQKHINVVSSIPNDISNMGIVVKVDGSSSDVPAMTTVDSLNNRVEQVTERLNGIGKHSTDFSNWTDLAEYVKENTTDFPDRNSVGNVKIVIPAGNYVITDVNVFNNFTRRTGGLTFSGAGREVTTIYFNPTANNQYLFKNDDKILSWHFEDISFIGNRDKNTNFMLSISHGGSQYYTFDRCTFWDFDKVIDMQGTNNNSEFSFYSCAFSGRIKDGVLFVGDVNTSQASDQFLNYDFFACKFEVESGHFINMKYGGNINVYGGSFIHTEYDSEDAEGGTFFRFPHNSHSYGVCRLMVIGARFEHRNRKSLLIDSTWNTGNIEFLNCDMDCYSMVSDSMNWITAKFRGHNTFPSIKFDNCSLLGKHEYDYNTENFQFVNSIVYTSCFHSLLTDINDLFTFKTMPEQNFYNWGSAPPIKVENFRGYSNTVYDTTINGTLHAKTMLNKKVFSMKESHGGFPTMGGTIESTLPLGSIITGITLYCPPNAVTSGHDGDFTLITGEAQPTILATTANDLKPYWEGFDIQQLGFFVCDTEEKRRIILQSGQYIDQTTRKALCLIEYI